VRTLGGDAVHTLVVVAILATGLSAAADDKARAVVERAIKAHGGEDNLKKLRAARIKVEGTMTIGTGEKALAFTLEDTWQMPDKYRSSSSFRVMDKDITQTQAFDGESGWAQLNGRTEDMAKEALAEMREQKYAEDLDRLGFLADKALELSALDEAKVNGQPAAVVRVKAKGHRDVKLYFDKASGLLVKREHDVQDSASGELVTQEVAFADFRDKGGVQHWSTIAVLRAGKKVIEAKLKDIEFLDKVDPKVFAKP
jgi:hypothetical protein